MRAVLMLVACASFAGCLEAQVATDGTDGDRSWSEQCINDVCERCEDGVCTGALAEQRAEWARPHADTDVHEQVDLTLGAERSWTVSVDANATSRVTFLVADPHTRLLAVLPSICVRWEHAGPGTQSSGSEGGCVSGNLNLAISVNGVATAHTVLDWSGLKHGRHTFTVEAGPQANHLFADLVVDNPDPPVA